MILTKIFEGVIVIFFFLVKQFLELITLILPESFDESVYYYLDYVITPISFFNGLLPLETFSQIITISLLISLAGFMYKLFRGFIRM